MQKFIQRTIFPTIILLALLIGVSPAYAEGASMEIDNSNSAEDAQKTTSVVKAYAQEENEELNTEKVSTTEETDEAEDPTDAKVKNAEVEEKTAAPIEKTETQKKLDATATETKKADARVEEMAVASTAATTSAAATPATATETDSISMKCATPKNGWKTENGKVHFYKNSKIQTGWVVDSSYKNYGLQRYWMGAYGDLATNKISKTDANGSLTYSSKAGYVARNKFKESDGKFYLANNDGKLESTTGWLVTGKYDGGALQRYYVEASSHSVKLGFFKVDNNLYHGDGNQGFVIRWKTAWGNGILLADNDGIIYQNEGWLVTDKYDGHLERYRVDKSCGQYMGAHVGYFNLEGKTYLGLSNVGYVLRNASDWKDNGWYWVNNGGAYTYLTSGKVGWQNPSGFPQVSAYTVKLPSYCTGEFTYVSPSKIRPEASREDCINAFIQRAYEYIGTKYIEPYSTAPGGAVDCSGLVLQCLYATGMDLGVYNPYNHRWQAWQTYNSMNWLNNGTFKGISTNDLQRGDLVYYRGHVAIYIGGGNIIDSWPGQGVGVHGLYSRGNLIGAQRPFV